MDQTVKTEYPHLLNHLNYKNYKDFCSKTGKHGDEAIMFLLSELEKLRGSNNQMEGNLSERKQEKERLP